MKKCCYKGCTEVAIKGRACIVHATEVKTVAATRGAPNELSRVEFVSGMVEQRCERLQPQVF